MFADSEDYLEKNSLVILKFNYYRVEQDKKIKTLIMISQGYMKKISIKMNCFLKYSILYFSACMDICKKRNIYQKHYIDETTTFRKLLVFNHIMNEKSITNSCNINKKIINIQDYLYIHL